MTLAVHGFSREAIHRAKVKRRPVVVIFKGLTNFGVFGKSTDGKPGPTGSFGVRTGRKVSRQNLLYYRAMNVGEAEVSAEMVPCKLCMFDAEQMQHRGM